MEDIKNHIVKAKQISDLSLKRYNILRQIDRYENVLPGKTKYGTSCLKTDGFHSTDTYPGALGMRRESLYPPKVRIDLKSDNGEKIRVIMVEELYRQLQKVDEEINDATRMV